MNEEVIEVSEEIIPETAYTPIDYTEYLNKIIKNQNSSLTELQEFNKELSENIEVTLERLESLEEQNTVLIEQQSAMYELVGNIFILLTAFAVAVVIHKVLSVINGA